jgi:type IV pilus assembly protein PilA
MMKAIRKRLAGDEGFTLIELMVVVMIIAILIAIAIPSFLGFRKSAQDRSAQSDLRNVLLAEKASWLQTGVYTVDPAVIRALEPNASYDAADPTLGVVPTMNANGSLCLTRTSKGGTVFAVWESATLGTFFGTGSQVVCPAAAPWATTSW